MSTDPATYPAASSTGTPSRRPPPPRPAEPHRTGEARAASDTALLATAGHGRRAVPRATFPPAACDDAPPEPSSPSNHVDLDHADQVRTDSDAILIGTTTLRRDNPRPLVNSAERRAAREAAGKPAYPLKVTLTASGDLDAGLKFWHHGDRKVVYTVDDSAPKLRATLDGLADVVSTGVGTAVDLGAVLDDLGARGVRRLMVEGGGSLHTQFLAQGLADEVHMAIAPLLVGDLDAPRFLNPAAYPGGSTRRLTLLEARPVGDVVLLRYAPKLDTEEASA